MTIGRPLQFNPDTVLDTAMQLFWKNGYESTSLQNLLKAMKLSKSSFYQAFKSKHSLFQQCLRQYTSLLLVDLQKQLDEAKSARYFIEQLFRNVANETIDNCTPKGCLLVNTASEFAQGDEKIAYLIHNGLSDIVDLFERAIKQAQQEGDIAVDKDSHKLALYLISSMSGLKNMTKSGADSETINTIVDLILSALKNQR